jgi:hypothetical protein
VSAEPLEEPAHLAELLAMPPIESIVDDTALVARDPAAIAAEVARLRRGELTAEELAVLAEAQAAAASNGKADEWIRATPDERDEHVVVAAAFRAGARASVGRAGLLAGYLEDVRSFACRYVAFPSEHEPIAIALWIAQAHLVEHFETSPILAVTSAEMRSGKTRTLDVLELLVPSPFRLITPSEAVTYTLLAQRPRPTMLLDEADAIFGPRTAERYEGLRAILNSGNRQGTPVPRVKLDGKRREVDWFDVFGPKAIAGIGNLPDTVTDRSIPIRLKRRAPDETVAKFRRRTAQAEASTITFDWSTVGQMGVDVPVPDELNDRAADSWEPLISIADLAGGSWPTMARMAAVALSSEDEAPASVGMRLLADIREAFGDLDHLTTAGLLDTLHGLDDAPWGDWYGKPLTARGLAKLLGPYRILPTRRRLGDANLRGYFHADFVDAWARYVPASAPGTSGTSGTPGAPDPVPVPDVPDVPGAEAQTALQLDVRAEALSIFGDDLVGGAS